MCYKVDGLAEAGFYRPHDPTFLDAELGQDLIELARDGLTATHPARRADALRKQVAAGNDYLVANCLFCLPVRAFSEPATDAEYASVLNCGEGPVLAILTMLARLRAARIGVAVLR